MFLKKITQYNLCHKDFSKCEFFGGEYLKVEILGGKGIELSYLDFEYFSELVEPPLLFLTYLIGLSMALLPSVDLCWSIRNAGENVNHI